MKRTIEIDDDLQERIDDACEELKIEVIEYLKKSGPFTDEDELYQEFSDRITELADSYVPIYYYELRNLWYLHSDLLTEAYESVGIGSDPFEKDGAVAIYCHIDQEVRWWLAENADQLIAEHCPQECEDCGLENASHYNSVTHLHVCDDCISA